MHIYTCVCPYKCINICVPALIYTQHSHIHNTNTHIITATIRAWSTFLHSSKRARKAGTPKKNIYKSSHNSHRVDFTAQYNVRARGGDPKHARGGGKKNIYMRAATIRAASNLPHSTMRAREARAQ